MNYYRNKIDISFNNAVNNTIFAGNNDSFVFDVKTLASGQTVTVQNSSDLSTITLSSKNVDTGTYHNPITTTGTYFVSIPYLRDLTFSTDNTEYVEITGYFMNNRNILNLRDIYSDKTSTTTYFSNHLKNGSSYSMNVNGSISPVTFSYTTTAITYITKLNLLIGDSACHSVDKYGNESILTNGVYLYFKKNGAASNSYLFDSSANKIKTNLAWEVLSDNTQFQFQNNPEYIRYSIRFYNPLYLESGGSINMVIQDNLTGLTHHRCHIQGYTKN